jgi:endonuclease-3
MFTMSFNTFERSDRMAEEIILNDEEVQEIVKAIIEIYPESGTDLNYETNFQLLCAVILSAQTTDIAVNRVSPELFEKFPTPEKMADASLEDIREIIRSIGLSNNKSKYLKNMARALIENFDGEVPDNRKDLMSLPGVGRKTANVVLTNGFDMAAFAVDTHVKRVSRRLHFVPEDASIQEIERIMMDKLPENIWYQAHHSILLFGRHQCVARKHDHSECLERIKDALPENDTANAAFEKLR